jgi:hypothetical protein
VSAAVLTPFTSHRATPAGPGRWRKKLLPIGEISYQGRVLKFTKDYLAGLVGAFRDKAYDQVPFQLADAKNTHTNDPERTRGQITEMTLEPDGLWIELDPTQAGQAVLTDNPGLGVSARIVEGYDRADGKFFPKAIQHVLGTLDPRIPGMGGWAAVEAANDAVTVTLDLSAAYFAGEEPGMPELTDDQQARLAKLLDLDPDKLAALVAAGGGAGLGQAPVLNGDGGGSAPAGGEDDDPEAAAIAARIDALTDEELAELERELEAEEAGQPVAAGLANDAGALAVELAQAGVDENARQLSIITAQLDTERWNGERQRLVAGGTPPYIADLAQPLLEGAGHVVDLANGTSVDAGLIVRKILGEYQKLGQQLGIGVELGTAMDEPVDTEAETARSDLVKRARQQMFGLS